MTIHKALNPIIEDSVDASIQRLEDDIKKLEGRLIAATINNTDRTSINVGKITRIQKWKKNNSMNI